MSSVDERIVRMVFDNSRFETAVQTTLKTLANLKSALNFDKVGADFSKLDQASKKVDFSHMSDALDQISDRFSTFGIVGMTVLQDLTRTAMSTAKNLLSSLTSPIIEGGKRRALNIEQAKFQIQGLGYAWEDVSEDINYGVKNTAYGLDSAAKAASQLLASNVAVGDSMKAALRGISGVAAMTSSEYDDIARVFTTVAGNGRLMGDQLNQLSARGLNVAATLGQALGKTEGEIREMVSKGSIDFATFSKAMDDAFGEHAKKANDTFSGSLSNMKAALSRIGAEFATPAYTNLRLAMNALTPAIDDVKASLKPLIETASKAMEAGSQLAVDILGNLNLKEKLIAPMDAANKIAVDFGKILVNLGNAIYKIISPIVNSFEKAFGGTLLDILVRAADAIANLTSQFIISDRMSNNIERTFTGVFTVLSVVSDVLATIAEIVGTALFSAATGTFGFIADILLTITGGIGDLVIGIKNLVDDILSLDIFKTIGAAIATVIETIGTASDVAYKAVQGFAESLFDKTFETFAFILGKIAEAIKFVANALNDAVFKIAEFVQRIAELPVVQETISNVANGFHALKTNISNVAQEILGKLKPAFTKVISVLTKYGTKVKEFIKAHANIESVQTGLTKIIEFATNAFNNGKEIFQNVTELFKNIFDRMKEVAEVNFDSITRRFWELKDAIVQTIDAGGKLDALKNFLKSAKEWFDAFLSGSGTLVEKVKENFIEFTGWIKDKFSNISFGDILAAGAGGSLIAFTLSLTKFTNAASKAIKPFGEVIEAFKAVPEGIGNALNAWAGLKEAEAKNQAFKTVAEIIKNLALLAGAVALLATMDPERVKVSAIALGALSAGLIVLSAVCAKLLEGVNPEAIGKFATLMITTSVSLFILVLALKKLSGIKPEALVSGLVGIGVLMLELGVFVAIVGKVAPKMEASTLSLIAMGISLNIMARAMKSMGDLSISQIMAAVAVMGAMGLMLVALTAVTKNNKQTVASALSIVTIAVALNLMIKALNSLASMDSDTVKAGLERMIELVGVVAILFVASAFAGKNATRAGIMLIGMTVALNIMAKAIRQLAEIDDSTMSRAGEVVKQILVVFGIITATTALAGKYAARAGASIGIMSASLLLTVGAIAILANLDPEGVERGMDAITRILLMFALITAATGLSRGAEKTMTALGVTVGGLAVAISILSLINPDNLKAASLSLGFVMGMFALLVASASTVKQSAKTVLLMVGVVGFLAGCLKMLSDLPIESTLVAAGSLSALVLSLSASAAILQMVNPAAAAKGALGFVAVVGAVGVLLAGLASIQELTNGEASSFLQSGIPVLAAIGEAIGSFVGSLAGSLAGSAVGTALEYIGTSLSNFMVNIQGFLDGASKIDQASVDGIGSLVAMILMLTGAELLNRLANFGSLGSLFGESGIDALGNDLVAFAESIKKFVSEVSEIDEGSFTRTKAMLEAVVAMVSSVTAEGGIKGFINGSSSEAIGNLADKLPGFAKSLVSVAETLSGMSIGNYAAIAQSIEPIKAVFSLLDAIKEEGGWEDYIGGSSSEAMGNLSNVLPLLAKAMVSYSDTLSNSSINYEAIANSIEPAKNLFTLLEAIRDEGGVIDFWGGSASEAIGNLADRLPALGLALVWYSEAVSAIDNYDAVYKSIEPCKALFQLLEYIRNEGGVLEFFMGNASTALGNLSNVLPLLGEGLKSYASSLENVDLETIEASLPAVKSIAYMTQALDNESVWSFLGGSHTQALQNLATAFPKVGEGLRLYSKEIEGVDPSNIEKSLSPVRTLAYIAEAMESESIISFLTGGHTQALENLALTFPLVGEGLAEYSDSLKGANLGKVNDSISAVQALASISSSLDSESVFNVFGSHTQALKNLSDALPSVAVGIKGYCDNLTGADLSVLNGSVDAVATMGSMVTELSKEGGVLDWITGTKTEALDNFSLKLPKLGQALWNFCDKLDSDSGFDVEKVQGAADSLKTLSEIAASLGGEEGGLLGMLKNLIGDDNSVGDLEKDLGALASALGVFASNISTTSMEGIESNIEQCKKIAEFLSGLDGINKDKAAEFAEILRTSGDMGLPLFIQGLSSVSAYMTSNLSTILENCGSIAAFLKSIADNDINKDNVQKFAETLSTCGDLGLPIFTKSITSNVPEFAESLNSLNSCLSFVVPQITDLCVQLKDAIGVETLNFSDDGKQVGTSFTDGLSTALETGFNYTIAKISGMSKELYDAVKSAFVNAKKDFYGFGVGISTNLDLGLRSINFYYAGRDAMTGLAKGITENQDLAIKASKKAAEEMLKSAKEALDSNSPSKKFIKLGADCDRGMAIGIDKYSHLVREAGSKIGVEALENTSLAINKLSELSDFDIDTNPKISPVLDISSIEAGAKKMNAMLDHNMKAIQLSADVSTKMSGSASDAILQNEISKQISISQNNDRVVKAIDALNTNLEKYAGNTTIIDGITYGDGGIVSEAMGQLVDAITLYDRM